MNAPTLVFGWGNPARGDDALGPTFVAHFEQLAARHPEWGAVECLTDFQLQIEHALDLQGRRRVLFVDASVAAPAPCTLHRIAPARDASFTSHALSPQAVMAVHAEIEDAEPPPCWLLSIRAEGMELGADLSAAARERLASALTLAAAWMVGDATAAGDAAS